jgi:putative peptidoglycan lipid II flippase
MHSVVGYVHTRILPRFRTRVAALRTEHKQIARGMLVVSTFVLLAKLIAMFKEATIAWRFGISEAVDAYLLVFNLTQYPVVVWAGPIAAVLVPYVARLRTESQQHLSQFRSELLGGTILLAVALGLVCQLLLPSLLRQPWVGLTAGQARFTPQMSAPLVGAMCAGFLICLWSAWTMSGNHHLNTLLEAMPALLILVSVLLVGDPASLAWGTLIGFVLQAVLLGWSLARHKEIDLPLFRFTSPYWRAFLSTLVVMLLGQILINGVGLIDQLVAARLGPGALSTLGYANRLLSVLLSLSATVIARAMLPVLSHAHAQSRDGLKRVANQWAVLMGSVGLVISIAGALLAPAVVQLLFERGQFTIEDTAQVTHVVRFALIQIPFYLLSIVFVHALLSRGWQSAVALIGGIGLIVKVGLSLIFVPALGLGGLMLATSGVYAVSSLISGWLIRSCSD